MFSLKGKSAVVTGGGSGIGKAIAILFAKQGAEVHIIELNKASNKQFGKKNGEIFFKSLMKIELNLYHKT